MYTRSHICVEFIIIIYDVHIFLIKQSIVTYSSILTVLSKETIDTFYLLNNSTANNQVNI